MQNFMTFFTCLDAEFLQIALLFPEIKVDVNPAKNEKLIFRGACREL